MIRGCLVAVTGAAVLVTAVSGCSNKTSDKTAPEGTSGMSAATGAGVAKVTIDGRPKEIQGQAVGTDIGGNLSIAIGGGTSGIAVVMAPDASTVNSVGLGNVDGVTLGYLALAPGASATATKDGNTYTVTGTASGMDMANPLQPITKPFEIVVTCP